MRTYDAWFPRYALGNGLMFSVEFSRPPWDKEVPHCRLFSTAARKGLKNCMKALWLTVFFL